MYPRILVTDSRLVPGDLIAEGEKLLAKLEERKFPISAAFWRYPDERLLPRLVIVSPLVGTEGPLETYAIIHKAVDDLGDQTHFGLSDISVMSPSGTEFQDLRKNIEDAGIMRPLTAASQCLALGDIFLCRWNP